MCCSSTRFEGTQCIGVPHSLKKSIHSLSHLVVEIDCAFNHFNCKALNKEILKLQKASNESVEQFNTRFCNLAYQFTEDEIDWEFLDGIFEYLLYISKNHNS